MSRLLLGVLGAVAEFERSLIRERQAEGIAQAKAKGVYRGRARRLSPEQVVEARERVSAGVPLSRVAREAGVSRSVMDDAVKGRGAYADVSEVA
ncbi:recombinase family protein [Aeromicrobium phragmitis]|uniref:Recombinase family protein n=2 Tax=Aeromicrobium TaxID=2040 RepID=A0A3N6WJQ9_9ACTN|nr:MULTISPECIES: recombinase family protein [Aeromicrobium]RLV54517.1 recombinase family protein [Aeromicrobium phragmitis]RQN02015.1 recombinase family protein [Aeromicrobium camelliae]